MNLCGVNPATKSVLHDPATGDYAAVLATPDCSCVNYWQSTVQQPTVLGGADFLEFQQFLQAAKVPPGVSSNGYCWWPPCTGVDVTALVPSFVETSKGECTNITNCIVYIQKQNIQKSDVHINVSNACGSNSKDPSGPYGSGKGGGGGGGPGGGPGGGGRTGNFFSKMSTQTKVICIVGAVVVMAAGLMLALVVFNRWKSAPARPAMYYAQPPPMYYAQPPPPMPYATQPIVRPAAKTAAI
jgi:hypothetical protein